jgi:hypothetical protein
VEVEVEEQVGSDSRIEFTEADADEDDDDDEEEDDAVDTLFAPKVLVDVPDDAKAEVGAESADVGVGVDIC